MNDVTMEEVAKLAGVSRTTVSRVISNPDKVKRQTCEKVLQVMERIGYSYNAGAAELIRGRTLIIGLLLPSIAPTFGNSLLMFQEVAEEMGMSIMLGFTNYDVGKEAAKLRQFMARRLSGMIAFGYNDANMPLLLQIQRSGTPTVVVSVSPKPSELCQVGFDNENAAATAVRHLVTMGHRRIAMISGPLSAGCRVRDRIRGFRNVMAENGLTVPENHVVPVQPTIENGEREAIRLLSLSSRPTAIFAASDMLAIGVLSGAKKSGLDVPRDLSVIGFDDINFAAHSHPPLTTIAVPQREIAHMAITLLQQMIGDDSVRAQNICLPTKIIVRESCSPPSRT